MRDYCGRDGGNPGPGGGDYNRFFVVGNWKDGGETDASQYQADDEHIMIGKSDTNDRDVLAHEFGHLIDHHYRDDYLSTFEGRDRQGGARGHVLHRRDAQRPVRRRHRLPDLLGPYEVDPGRARTA